jgi:hypothetical protein
MTVTPEYAEKYQPPIIFILFFERYLHEGTMNKDQNLSWK